jgi:hypothetical protein
MADVMLTTYAAAQAIDGRACGADVGFARVTTDSRAVQAGDLFVALKGERFDAHDFVAGALAAGAAAALVRADFPELPGASLIRVDDTLAALGRLAAHWRTVGFAGRMAGITGSSGKTSVKEMLRAILVAEAGEDAVLATAGNLNNDIGVPLTLLRLRAAHRFAVIEMGMNHPGEIRYLASLARADAVAINNAQRAHAGHFASVADIARAKGELFESLPAGVTACVNLDDAYAGLWQTLAGDAGRQGFKQLALGAGDVRHRGKMAGVGALGVVDGHRIGARQAGQIADFAGMVHAHLDHGKTVCRAQAQQGQRHADVVVQIAGGGQHGVFAGFGHQDGAQHFLDAGLAAAAGDAGHTPGKAHRAPMRRQPAQGRQGVVHPDQAGAGQLRKIRAHQRCRRASSQRAGDKIMRVKALALESDK